MSPCGLAGPSGPTSSALILHFPSLRSGHLRSRGRACGRCATDGSKQAVSAQNRKIAAVRLSTPEQTFATTRPIGSRAKQPVVGALVFFRRRLNFCCQTPFFAFEMEADGDADRRATHTSMANGRPRRVCRCPDGTDVLMRSCFRVRCCRRPLAGGRCLVSRRGPASRRQTPALRSRRTSPAILPRLRA